MTVERCILLERDDDDPSPYGPVHLLALRDDRGSAMSWITGTRTYEVGARIRLRGTVKSHREYHGEAVTQLTRCAAERVRAEDKAETRVVTKGRKSPRKATKKSTKTAEVVPHAEHEALPGTAA